MIFQSFQFLTFFLVVLFGARIVLGKFPELRKLFLLVASYFFYMCWDWRFGGLILAITFINYYIGPKIQDAEDDGAKKRWLALSLIISIAILAYFKYANFFIDSMNDLLTLLGFSVNIPLLNVLLPIGISFYTFQSISYTLDIYRGRTEAVKSFSDFALFVAFFPQLVAGPIVRASHFLPQLKNDHKEEPDSMETGVALMIRGFIKKVAFADVLAVHFVDPAFANPELYSPIFLLVAIYAYSYQVYMDFSGYTDIARGVARTLGYELQINFNRPYQAVSVSNFWQRWHISMSSFFRDYLFFGIGGSRYGNVYFNLMVTFVAIGIWHGAGWNFVLYGILHGTFVGLERWRRNKRAAEGISEPEYHGIRLAAQWFWIFNVVAFSRLLFRGGSLDSAIHYAKAMTHFEVTSLPVNMVGGAIFVLAFILHYTPLNWTYGWKSLYCRIPVVIQSGLIVGVLYFLVAISTTEAPFIYFQF
ncbi:MAG: MBOAT family protein [Alphaproteobacteria bacterium]|nr:MBOAT family protein [Alphaproteobacteria bacterium]HPF45551.1 MBOAT family O-acyltransferase [Emcibacteraceae bacterium]HRW29832.1 MBOAT family O-acyltransferase [Emcibacteraceae bacterium]